MEDRLLSKPFMEVLPMVNASINDLLILDAGFSIRKWNQILEAEVEITGFRLSPGIGTKT